MDRRKTRNYKLVLDPNLKPGSQKVYRFDGSLPGVILINIHDILYLSLCVTATIFILLGQTGKKTIDS